MPDQPLRAAIPPRRATLLGLLFVLLITLLPLPTPGEAQTLRHCYVLIEVRPAVPTELLNSVWPHLRRSLGQQFADSPGNITHYRMRPDHHAVILEAVFDPLEINRRSVLLLLAEAAGVSYEQADQYTTITPFACAQGYLASRDAAATYLREHASAWQEENES